LTLKALVAVEALAAVAYRSAHVEGETDIDIVAAISGVGVVRRGGGRGGGAFGDRLGRDVDGNGRPEILIIPTLRTTTRHRPLLCIANIAIVISLFHAPNNTNIKIQQSILVAVGTAQCNGREGIIPEGSGGAEI